jgi:hypothetical protein
MELFLILFILFGTAFYIALKWAKSSKPEEFAKAVEDIKHGIEKKV